MSKWKYVPNGESPPQNITFYSYDFELSGKAVEIDDPAAEAKMEHNPSFEKVKVKGPRAEGAPLDGGKPTNPNKGKPKKIAKKKAAKK